MEYVLGSQTNNTLQAIRKQSWGRGEGEGGSRGEGGGGNNDSKSL